MALSGIDRHWDQCHNFDQHWSALGIDRGSAVNSVSGITFSFVNEDLHKVKDIDILMWKYLWKMGYWPTNYLVGI